MFVRANMERVAGGAKKLYIYNAGADAIATVTTAGYFNDMSGEMDAGDVIKAITGSNAAVKDLVVTSARFAAQVTTTA